MRCAVVAGTAGSTNEAFVATTWYAIDGGVAVKLSFLAAVALWQIKPAVLAVRTAVSIFGVSGVVWIAGRLFFGNLPVIRLYLLSRRATA